jgi:hypothetical protein
MRLLRAGQSRLYRCTAAIHGLCVDALFAPEHMRAVAPMAVEAAQLAEQRKMERRLLELELQQARYDASLAEHRYATCDPDSWQAQGGQRRPCYFNRLARGHSHNNGAT